MAATSLVLPSNWLNEFQATAVSTPTGSSRSIGAGSVIRYTCEVCVGEPEFSTKYDAKRHALGKKHRELVKAGQSEPLVARRLRADHTGARMMPLESSQQLSGGVSFPYEVPPSPASWHLPSSPDAGPSSPAPAIVPAPLYSAQPDDAMFSAASASHGHADYDDFDVAWEYDYDTGLPSVDLLASPALGPVRYDLPDSDTDSEFGKWLRSDWSTSSEPDATSDSESSSGADEGLQHISDYIKACAERSGGPRRPWDPYPNATYAILDVITNFPRHPVSDELLRIILWGLTALGVKDVPPVGAFREFQGFLRKSETFAKSRACVSVLRNHFTTNDILKSIGLDMANPLVREHIVFYPEDPVDGTSELRHSPKWLRDLPDCELTPMWAASGGKHFYVQELAQERDGKFVVPLRWFLRGGEMYMVYFPVYSTECGLEVDRSTRLERSARFLETPLPELLSECRTTGTELTLAALTREKCNPTIQNPWRTKAGGLPCYKYFILFGGDDVSGNRSKSWNKHNCFYYCAAGLPLECLNQEYYVHFISSSQFAGPLEQLAAITDRLRSVRESGLVCFDCLASKDNNPTQKCLIIPDLFVGTGDGPWQSELSSHSGDSCRFCKVPGTVKEKSSDTGFLALMEAGEQRTPKGTREQIASDLETATRARQGTTLANTQQATGVNDRLAQTVIDSLVQEGKDLFDERREDGKKRYTPTEIHNILVARRESLLKDGDFINSLLNDDVFDPHQDTALGRLHPLLLGFAKYFWSASLPATGRKLTNAEKEALDKAEAIFVSLNQDGLGDRSVRADYIMRYRGSLVGRHLHSITQLAIFAFGRIVSTELRTVWITLSRLCAMLFAESIKDINNFVKQLHVVIDDYFDAVVQFNPTWVMYKTKFHHLPHSPHFIMRFGPMGLYAEDRFEKFHGVWRNSSVFSNHHSASRDSAAHFNSIDATKHILSGGYFMWQGSMVQGGPQVLKLFNTQLEVRARFGLRKSVQRELGSVRVASKGKSKPWDSLGALNDNGLEDAWARDLRRPHHEFYGSTKAMVSMRGDICKPGMFVWCSAPQAGVACIHTIFARERTLSSGHGPDAIVRVELFAMTNRHPDTDCPCLKKGKTHLVLAKDILFAVNVQHDCFTHDCPLTGRAAQVQEREKTSRSMRVVKHLDDTDFILNVFVFHHYDELVEVLPPEFVGPAVERPEEERTRIRLAAAEVLRKQIKAREATKGAVRQARATAKPPAKGSRGLRGGGQVANGGVEEDTEEIMCAEERGGRRPGHEEDDDEQAAGAGDTENVVEKPAAPGKRLQEKTPGRSVPPRPRKKRRGNGTEGEGQEMRPNGGPRS